MIEAKTGSLKNMDYHLQIPVDTLYNWVECFVEYTEMAQLPVNEKDIIEKSYGTFNNTQKNDRAITKCNQRPRSEQTWVNLKWHFRIAKK